MLAPMEGVTNAVFREMVAERGGVGIVCTEFVRIGTQPMSPKRAVREVRRAPGVPLCVQVMGNVAERMAEAARMMADLGADVVDINLGCPSPRVVRKGVGSAMLKDPELLYNVVSLMRREVPGLMSAKIRAGFDDASGVVEIARTVQAAGIDYLVVHPRRRSDFYTGVADWRIVRTLKSSLEIPVVGNGDCWYAADAPRMQAETGCDAVMLGRPALRNPWIFQQIDSMSRGEPPFDPSGADVVAYMHDLAQRYWDEFGVTSNSPVGRMKEMVTYLGRAVRDGGVFRRDALRTPTLEGILELAKQRLATLSASELDLRADGDNRLEKSGSALQMDALE